MSPKPTTRTRPAPNPTVETIDDDRAGCPPLTETIDDDRAGCPPLTETIE